MKKISLIFCIAIIFIVVLFAGMDGVSLATGEEFEVNGVFSEIIARATKGSITINVTGQTEPTMTIPTMAISQSEIQAILREHGIEDGAVKFGENGKMQLTVGGKTYEKTVSLGIDSEHVMAPDGAYREVIGSQGVITEAIQASESRAIDMYNEKNGTNEDEIEYFTFGFLELEQQRSMNPQDRVSFSDGGRTGSFFISDEVSNQYDLAPNLGTVEAEETINVVVDSSGNVVENNGDAVVPNNYFLSEDEGTVSEVPFDETTKSFNFTPAVTGNYIVELRDESGTVCETEIICPSMGNANVALASNAAHLEQGRQYVVTPPDDGKTYTLVVNFYEKNMIDDPSHTVDSAEVEKEKAKSAFEEIEKIMSEFVMSLAKVLNWAVSKAFGRTLTIDNIVFIDKNGGNFEDVRLTFFESENEDPELSAKSPVVELLKPAINEWYNIFQNVALVGYMIVLVYIGIKMLLNSTTPEKMASYKQTFFTWVTGVAILLFMPFYMKYAILLNEAFVIQISNMRSDEARKGAISTSVVMDDATTYLNATFENDEERSSVINFEGNDYMSKVGKMAEQSKKLGVSLAYMIMTWQLIMIIIYYYKRVFITAFLIMIFPLVALTYVWDKLNDNKSQALSIWIHEFSIGVFMQSFHAIVFVFVTNTIYSTLKNDSADFILLMIAASFMFAGEEILKQIFNGGGPPPEAYGSVAQTAGKIAAVGGIATRVTTRTVNNLVGKNGFVRTTVRSMQDARKNGLIKRNFNTLSTPPRTGRVNALLPADTSIPITPDMQKAAETVETLNHMDRHSAEDVAKAINDYHDLKGKLNLMDPNTRKTVEAILGKSHFNDAQIDRLDKGMINAAVMASSGSYTTKQIMQTLKLEVDIAFPEETEREKKVVTDKILRAALINMREYGASRGQTRESLENEWDNKIDQMRDINDNIKFARDGLSPDERIRGRANVIESQMRKSIRGYDQLSGEQKNTLKRFAMAVAVSKDVKEYEDGNDANAEDKFNNAQAEIQTILQDEEYAFARTELNDVIQKNLMTNASERVSESRTRKERKEKAIQNRVDGLLNQVKSNFESQVQTNEATGEEYIEVEGQNLRVDVLKECARDISKLEQLNTEMFSEYDAYKAVTDLEQSIRGEKAAEANALLRLSNIEKDIDTLKYMLAKKIASESGDYATRLGNNSNLEEAMNWAQQEVARMEQRAFNEKVNADPVVLIYDILAAANGKKSGSGRKNIDTLESLFGNVSSSDGASSIIDDKHLSARSQNQRERMAAQDFARDALRELGVEEIKEEEATYNGYTRKEIEDLEKSNKRNARGNVAGALSDVVLGGVGAVVGTTVGMAFTDDGIPLGEAATGAVSGLSVANFVTDSVITKVGGAGANKKIGKIEDKVAKRLKTEETERLKARQAFADAEYASRGKADTYLELKLATARLYISADEDLCATVYVQAENAEYVAVGETPSFSWQPFQEQVNYVFRDNDPNKSRNLYVYVKDNSGNIKRSVIRNVKLDN